MNNTQYWTNCFKYNQTVGLCPSVQVDMSDVAISFISSGSTSQMTQIFMGLCCKTKRYLFNNMVLYMMRPDTSCTFYSFSHLKHMVRIYWHLLGNDFLNDLLNPLCSRVQTDLFPRSLQGGTVLKIRRKISKNLIFDVTALIWIIMDSFWVCNQ